MFTLLSQELQVDEIGDIVISTAEQDPVLGDWVRDIRIYGVRPIDATTSPLLFSLKLRSASQSALDISTPASVF